MFQQLWFLHKSSSDSCRIARQIRFELASLGALLLVFFGEASAQEKPCCSITSIDARSGLVSAEVIATGQGFHFKPNNLAFLNSMKVGEGVYANFKTQKVSLDGRIICCAIIAVGPASVSQPPIAKAPSPSGPGTTPNLDYSRFC